MEEARRRHEPLNAISSPIPDANPFNIRIFGRALAATETGQAILWGIHMQEDWSKS